MFPDRQQAGRALALELARLELEQPLVLALPPGGVPVAAEVAAALAAALDLAVLRLVPAPENGELALAAIVDGDPPDIVVNRSVVEAFGLDEETLAPLVGAERAALENARHAWRGSRRPLSATGHSVILVDDGAATGTTMKLAIRALRRRSPRAVVAALPVASADALAELAGEADRIVCVSRPARFYSLAHHYLQFPPVPDDEVRATLAAAAARRKAERKR